MRLYTITNSQLIRSTLYVIFILHFNVCMLAIAQVCSDINKPNGQFVLPNERAAVVTFISSLPIRKVLLHLFVILLFVS